jgi:hypothetical protein
MKFKNVLQKILLAVINCKNDAVTSAQPYPSVPICGSPRFFARDDTLLGSAVSMRPYSSQCSLSSARAAVVQVEFEIKFWKPGRSI